jgi:hypothetical protein
MISTFEYCVFKRAPLVLDLQILCISYLDILNYEKNDITNFTRSNKKIYDIWYHKYSKHEIKEYNGKKEWYVNHKLHRDNDLPAVEYMDGSKQWYQNGLNHRENDLPAIEINNGTKWWMKNGKLHRDNDLPAVVGFNGYKYWYKNGKLHRDDYVLEGECIRKPTIEYSDGYKF